MNCLNTSEIFRCARLCLLFEKFIIKSGHIARIETKIFMPQLEYTYFFQHCPELVVFGCTRLYLLYLELAVLD